MISLVLFIYTHKCLVHMSMPDRMAKYFQSRLNMSIGTFYNDIGKRNRMKNSQMCTCLFFLMTWNYFYESVFLELVSVLLIIWEISKLKIEFCLFLANS